MIYVEGRSLIKIYDYVEIEMAFLCMIKCYTVVSDCKHVNIRMHVCVYESIVCMCE